MKRLIHAMTLQEAYDVFDLTPNDKLNKDNIIQMINETKIFINQTRSRIEKEKAEKELQALYILLDNCQLTKQARTSIQFDNNLQPFLINGTDLIELDDEYIKLAKKMLSYLPILPTNERVYDLALYLCLYNIEDIEQNFDTYLELSKNYLVNQKLLDKNVQTTNYAKLNKFSKLNKLSKLDNLFIIQQELDTLIKQKYGNPAYIGPQDKLYSYNDIADEYERYGDDYYSLDEWALMNGYRKFDIYKKSFNDANHVYNFCRKQGLRINNEIVF